MERGPGDLAFLHIVVLVLVLTLDAALVLAWRHSRQRRAWDREAHSRGFSVPQWEKRAAPVRSGWTRRAV